MKTPRSLRLCLVGAMVAGASFTACEKAPPPAPPAPKKAEAPPPAPEPVRADALLQTMKADARVQFSPGAAPTDETLARAVITFADALARGDSEKFKSMLDPAGRGVLDKLVAEGLWDDSTGKAIEAVRVAKYSQVGDSAATFVLAIQEPRGAYPLQWAMAKAAGMVVISAIPTANMVKSRASEFDSLDVTAALAPTGAAPALAAPTAHGEQPAAPAGGNKATPAASPPHDESVRRRGTPNGPVNVPTGKPSGG